MTNTDSEKLLRILIGVCATSVWCSISKQWTEEQALAQIHTGLLKVAEAMNINLNSTSQIERLRDEAVKFVEE